MYSALSTIHTFGVTDVTRRGVMPVIDSSNLIPERLLTVISTDEPSTVIGVVHVAFKVVLVRVQVNVRLALAGAYRSSPAWDATIVHLEVSAGIPGTASAAYPPFEVAITEQVAGVDDARVTLSPELVETVSGLSVLRSRFGGVVNAID
jgi:hypothetical protein